MRGIVITHDFLLTEGRDGVVLGFTNPASDALTLRHHLLYWDRIAFATNSIIGFTLSLEEEYLVDVGVMDRLRFAFSSFDGNPAWAFILSQLAAFERLNTESPGDWAMAQAWPVLALPPGRSNEARGFEIQLYNALPVPHEDVPLTDVLEFKQRRRDELNALRVAMDEIYLSVVRAGDVPRAKSTAILRLEGALKDFNAVAGESWRARVLRALDIKLQLPEVLVRAAEGMAIAQVFQVPLVIGAIAGTATAALKVDLKALTSPVGLSPTLKPFAYLHSAREQLGVADKEPLGDSGGVTISLAPPTTFSMSGPYRAAADTPNNVSRAEDHTVFRPDSSNPG